MARRARQGTTVVVSVHELPVAARLAEDALLLSSHSGLMHGSAQAVLAPEALETAFGVPFELVRTADGAEVPVAECMTSMHDLIRT